MANGGDYYNINYGGEVYYNTPTTIGAVKLIDAMVNKWHVMPPGVTDANTVTTAFFQGRTAMMILSTGSLSFVRENMKTPYKVAFLPRQRRQCRADRRRQPDHPDAATRRSNRPRRGR